MEKEKKTPKLVESPSTNFNSPLEVPQIQIPKTIAKFGCRDKIELFENETIVGKGTYGQVFKAYYKAGFNKDPTIPFALKQIKSEDEIKYGFPVTAIREIRILQTLRHKNIANLVEIVKQKVKKSTHSGDTQKQTSNKEETKIKIFLVFEYMDHDLYGLLNSQHVHLNYRQIKYILHEILQGLAFLHKKSTIHRDLKSSNILLNNKGEVKITDFGLSRTVKPKSKDPLSLCVVTLWYRAPEILLGNSYYSFSSDIWSLGVIFCEMLLGYVPFRGADERDQIHQIYKNMGSATDENWRGVSSLKLYRSTLGSKIYYDNLLKAALENKVEKTSADLCLKMLCYDPSKRISAEDALKHEYFTTQPLMCQPKEMPMLKSEFHELDIQERRDLEKTGNISHLHQHEMKIGVPYKPEGLASLIEKNKSSKKEKTSVDLTNILCSEKVKGPERYNPISAILGKTGNSSYLKIKRKSSDEWD